MACSQAASLPVGGERDVHPVLGLGVLDARLHGGDIVRLWTIPVSVSLDGSHHQLALAAVAIPFLETGPYFERSLFVTCRVCQLMPKTISEERRRGTRRGIGPIVTAKGNSHLSPPTVEQITIRYPLLFRI